MKVLMKESEAIQEIVRETMALLKQAHEKLYEVYDSDDVMQVNTKEAGYCVIHSGMAIAAAAAWLNSEHGEEQECVFKPTPKVVYTESPTFDF